MEIQLRLAFCSHYRNLEELQNDPDFEYLCPDLGKFTSSDVSSSLHKENEAPLELLYRVRHMFRYGQTEAVLGLLLR